MEIRRDVSAYLLHCTRGKEEDNLEAFDVLKMILSDGLLKATSAPYTIYRNGRTETRQAVRGPNRAVCFTEQPLKFFFETVKVNKSYPKERYTEFAIAVRKDLLFCYGGRPVIYTDKEMLENLPSDLQYLWVHYNPTAIWNGYLVDFTHEREWRACPNIGRNKWLGLSDQDAEIAVPLQLPTESELRIIWPIQFPKSARFAILVDSEKRKQELIDWISNNADRISEKGSYWERYANVLPKVPILSFEKTVNDAPNLLARLEDFINDDFTPITFSL